MKSILTAYKDRTFCLNLFYESKFDDFHIRIHSMSLPYYKIKHVLNRYPIWEDENSRWIPIWCGELDHLYPYKLELASSLCKKGYKRGKEGLYFRHGKILKLSLPDYIPTLERKLLELNEIEEII